MKMGGWHRENTTQEKPNFRRKNMKLENSKPNEEKDDEESKPH